MWLAIGVNYEMRNTWYVVVVTKDRDEVEKLLTNASGVKPDEILMLESGVSDRPNIFKHW